MLRPVEKSGDQPGGHTRRLLRRSWLVEHPAPNIEPGDVVVLADGREALVTARVEVEPLEVVVGLILPPELPRDAHEPEDDRQNDGENENNDGGCEKKPDHSWSLPSTTATTFLSAVTRLGGHEPILSTGIGLGCWAIWAVRAQ